MNVEGACELLAADVYDEADGEADGDEAGQGDEAHPDQQKR
ncbi:hypothetical protein [Micromonospora sp. NPDC005087]